MLQEQFLALLRSKLAHQTVVPSPALEAGIKHSWALVQVQYANRFLYIKSSLFVKCRIQIHISSRAYHFQSCTENT
jgi:hypothetical protein